MASLVDGHVEGIKIMVDIVELILEGVEVRLFEAEGGLQRCGKSDRGKSEMGKRERQRYRMNLLM